MLVGGEASERYLVERFDDVDARDPKAPKWRELMGRLGETDWEWRRDRVQLLRSENQPDDSGAHYWDEDVAQRVAERRLFSQFD